MKRKIISILFAVVLVLSFSLMAAVPAAAEDTITVGPSGCSYTSIQAAIDAASPNDTINVEPGTYLETIDVTKNNLIIQSVSGDPSNTIIDANGADSPVVTIADCSGVTLSGFTITGAQEPPGGGSRGIQMLRATGCTVSNIVVTKTGPLTAGRESAAIYLEGSSGNSFDSVTVSEISGGHVSGILLTGSNSNTFASTTISGITASEFKKEARGIWVTGGENNKFVDTEVTGITSLNSKALGIYADGNGNTFTSTEVSDIHGRTRVAGIQICHTTGVEFSDYHISNLTAEAYDSWGIRVFNGVTGCTFSGGSITGADIGVFVEKNEGGTGNSIHNTNIVGNGTFGVQNTAAPTIDATLNWWGTTDETTIRGMVMGNVLYDPWLKAPYRPTTLMSSFTIDHAKIDFKRKVDDAKVRVQGELELDLANGDGVVLGEDVIVTVGPLTETITMVEKGKKGDRWHYQQRPKEDGTGDIKHMTINWKNGKFDIRMDKADLTGVTNPMTISIQIGDDVGEETITMREKKDHWDYKAK